MNAFGHKSVRVFLASPLHPTHLMKKWIFEISQFFPRFYIIFCTFTLQKMDDVSNSTWYSEGPHQPGSKNKMIHQTKYMSHEMNR